MQQSHPLKLLVAAQEIAKRMLMFIGKKIN